MARRGRKRKPGTRERNGRVKRITGAQIAKEREPIMVTLNQPHRRWLPEALRTDQLAECELGRLYLAGVLRSPTARLERPEIARGRLWAGQRYHRLITAFLAALAAPRTTCSAGFSYVADGGEATADFDPLAHIANVEDEEERFDRLTAEVNRVTATLRVFHDCFLLRTVLDAVVLKDKAIGVVDLPYLRTALDVLARMWGLDESSKPRGHAYRAEPFTVDETRHERFQA